MREYGVVTPSLEQPISGLSGGNQQKSVLASSFLYGADVVLIDEPTQGVDAGARFEIYRAIRAKAAEGRGCVVNSSDALELAGICDRVLVFSRGRIIRELTGADVTEENIVSSFLMAREALTADARTEPPTLLHRVFETLAAGSSKWWIPLGFLAALTVSGRRLRGNADGRLPDRDQPSPYPAGGRSAGAGRDGAVQRAPGARLRHLGRLDDEPDRGARLLHRRRQYGAVAAGAWALPAACSPGLPSDRSMAGWCAMPASIR